MVIEYEFLEQAADSEDRWSLARSRDFIVQHKDAWIVLGGPYHDGCLLFVDANRDTLPGWKVQELFRSRAVSVGAEVVVRVTEAGARRVF